MIVDSAEAIETLKDAAWAHEDLYGAAIRDTFNGPNKDSDKWLSTRAKRLLDVAAWVEGLKSYFPMEIVENREQMREFERGTPFMVIMPEEETRMITTNIAEERILVIQDSDGFWRDTAGWIEGTRSYRQDPLDALWENIDGEGLVVIALPVPIKVPMIPYEERRL